jgi:ferric-dicitrate binding protein FerR (iron transport regulator)
MSGNLSVEELVIDDSFHNYCFQKKEEDVLFWEEYILANSAEKEKIDEAKQLVLGLTAMLKKEQEVQTGETKANPAKVISLPLRKFAGKKIKIYATVAAAAVALVLISIKFFIAPVPASKPATAMAVQKQAPADAQVFTTGNGEKRLFILPDSTKFWLNSGSELRVDKGFGKENRQVYLSGEALFDVTHNKSFPFIVHIHKYDIKVLGTLFNVKAYPGDNQSETSLIRGKVEIQMTNSSRKILLSPNQKVVIDTRDDNVAENKEKQTVPQRIAVVMLPLSYNSKDNTVIETAWAQNRLEIVDESFADIKEKLERWYNVKITFNDEEVSKYRFSATFEKETIQQVLKALQNAYPFTYETKDNDITISK